MFSFGSTKRKKTMRYKVVVKGVTISRHSTKALANQRKRSIGRYAKVVPLRSRRRVKTTRRRRRY